MYDAIFVGGGLNYAGAIVLAKRGKKVALVTEDLGELGGVCLHHGCIPSKNLLHRTKILYEIREDVFRSHKDPIKLKKLQSKLQAHIKSSTDSITMQCKAAGVELIEGKGFVTDKSRVKAGKRVLEAKNIIIGSGSQTFVPSGIEVDGKSIITSKEALKLTKLPKSIAIYGSGAIGLEFASFFAINGVKTHLLYRHDRISRKLHPTITEKLEEQLRDNGVLLEPNSSVSAAKRVDENVEILFENHKTLKVEMMLVATGRRADTDVVQTDKIKVEKGIKTDKFFETTLAGVFAIGDCNAKLQLAHAARAQVLNVVDNILGKKEVLNLDNIPKFIYTLPLSYAFVGIKTEKEVSFPLSYLGISGAVEGSKNGIVILYLDKEDFVMGAELFTPYAEELIGVFSTALAAELDVKTFKKAVFPHPTFSESIDRVLRRA